MGNIYEGDFPEDNLEPGRAIGIRIKNAAGDLVIRFLSRQELEADATDDTSWSRRMVARGEAVTAFGKRVLEDLGKSNSSLGPTLLQPKLGVTETPTTEQPVIVIDKGEKKWVK